MSNKIYKNTLKYFTLILISIIIILNTYLISIHNEELKHTTTIIFLNISASFATILCFVALIRYGVKGSHGKSYLFLTIGILLWFFADFSILYSNIFLGIDEQKKITIADSLWLFGYIFLTCHLISVIKSIQIRNLSKTISLIAVIIVIYIIINLINTVQFSIFNNGYINDHAGKEFDIPSLVITLLYPILDLCLIVPSIGILLNIYKEYQHSIPWLLSSISLLINAIADNGYTLQFIKGFPSAWPWDLFYITDFIIMSGALFWYNKYHISEHIRNKKQTKN